MQTTRRRNTNYNFTSVHKTDQWFLNIFVKKIQYGTKTANIQWGKYRRNMKQATVMNLIAIKNKLAKLKLQMEQTNNNHNISLPLKLLNFIRSTNVLEMTRTFKLSICFR